MQIILGNLKEGHATQVENTYVAKDLDMEFVDMKYLKPIDMTGTVEKSHDTLTFRGILSSEVERLCGRCVKSITQPLKKNFEFFYEIKGKEMIDATEDLREIFMLDHPLTYLCQDDCKGLCPRCGTNWNETKCQCPQPQQDSSLASLKDYWKKTHKENSHGKS